MVEPMQHTSQVISLKQTRLWVVLACFFVSNALVAEFIGGKIFSLEPTLGLGSLFPAQGPLQFSAGVILWPLVFIMTDLINEYFGFKAVRFLSWLTAAMIGYAFIMVYFAIGLSPADWWLGVGKEQGIENMQVSFSAVFGQSNWIIVGSMIAFLVGQLLDALIFQAIRKKMGETKIWIRATFSTLVSQFIDSFVVLYVAFVLGPQKWSLELFWKVGKVNYAYKFSMALLLIPLLYGVRALIEKYLGKNISESLKAQAVGLEALV